MSQVDDDRNECNESGNERFHDVVEERLSRRSLLTGGLAAAAALSLGGVEALLRAVPAIAGDDRDDDDDDREERGRKPLLGFESVPVSTVDQVIVPKGYKAEVL
ncbi:MAG: hypothetical protein NNA24_03895, partial [Nitrospira sp.]|nr:hypothetical protein [Nitrospira sp.]